MPAGVRTRIVRSARPSLGRFGRGLPKGGNRLKIAAQLAGLGKAIITNRTLQGLDANDAPFTPYSDKPYWAPTEKRPPGYPSPSGGEPTPKGRSYSAGYGQYKAGIGRPSSPQLSVSNEMLGNIAIATQGSAMAILFFPDREQAAKAHGHEFGTVVPKRSFFDLSNVATVAKMKLRTVQLMREAAKKSGVPWKSG